MKKRLCSITLVLILLFLTTSSAFANSDNHQFNSVENISDYVLKNSSQYLEKNADGTVTVKEDIYKIDAAPEVVNEFMQTVELVNKGVKRGIIYWNENFVPKAVDPDKIPKKELKIENYVYPQYDPTEPPYYNLMAVLWDNVEELDEVWEIFWAAQRLDPEFNAYYAWVGYWLEKVREGGEWDYKLALGWNKWYKVVINGKVDYIQGQDIGNINYGYTGTHIGLSPTTLKTGAHLASLIENLRRLGIIKLLFGDLASYFDDPQDQISIQRGIDMYNAGL